MAYFRVTGIHGWLGVLWLFLDGYSKNCHKYKIFKQASSEPLVMRNSNFRQHLIVGRRNWWKFRWRTFERKPGTVTIVCGWENSLYQKNELIPWFSAKSCGAYCWRINGYILLRLNKCVGSIIFKLTRWELYRRVGRLEVGAASYKKNSHCKARHFIHPTPSKKRLIIAGIFFW